MEGLTVGRVEMVPLLCEPVLGLAEGVTAELLVVEVLVLVEGV